MSIYKFEMRFEIISDSREEASEIVDLIAAASQFDARVNVPKVLEHPDNRQIEET